VKFLTIPNDGPAGRSPVERATRALGARIETRGGARVATSYGAELVERRRLAATVGVTDAAHLAVLELQTPPAEHAALTAAVVAVAPDAVLEYGSAGRAAGAWWCAVAPGRVLVVGEPAAVRPLPAKLDVSPVRATDLTTGHAAIVVAGPQARETIARVCALDLRPDRTPVGACRPGSIARTPGLVIREADDRYLLLYGAAYGAYLWSVVIDAAEHLGGGPVGLDALEGVPAHA
jgi:heterotetrameric sarcosine oxidase gamma subunit